MAKTSIPLASQPTKKTPVPNNKPEGATVPVGPQQQGPSLSDVELAFYSKQTDESAIVKQLCAQIRYLEGELVKAQQANKKKEAGSANE